MMGERALFNHDLKMTSEIVEQIWKVVLRRNHSVMGSLAQHKTFGNPGLLCEVRLWEV